MTRKKNGMPRSVEALRYQNPVRRTIGEALSASELAEHNRKAELAWKPEKKR